ncbi:hypothetical protein EON68_01060, partial [archaeon]
APVGMRYRAPRSATQQRAQRAHWAVHPRRGDGTRGTGFPRCPAVGRRRSPPSHRPERRAAVPQR